jgi:hypothetical protein
MAGVQDNSLALVSDVLGPFDEASQVRTRMKILAYGDVNRDININGCAYNFRRRV